MIISRQVAPAAGSFKLLGHNEELTQPAAYMASRFFSASEKPQGPKDREYSQLPPRLLDCIPVVDFLREEKQFCYIVDSAGEMIEVELDDNWKEKAVAKRALPKPSRSEKPQGQKDREDYQLPHRLLDCISVVDFLGELSPQDAVHLWPTCRQLRRMLYQFYPLHAAVAAAEIVASATLNDTNIARRGSRGNSERSKTQMIASRSKLIIPRSSWEAIVKETLQELGGMQSDPRITVSALLALQCAGEAYVESLLRGSTMIADRSDRKTLELEDLLLAISLRQAGGDRVLDGYCPAKRARHY